MMAEYCARSAGRTVVCLVAAREGGVRGKEVLTWGRHGESGVELRFPILEVE
jgi:hypothetical protein